MSKIHIARVCSTVGYTVTGALSTMLGRTLGGNGATKSTTVVNVFPSFYSMICSDLGDPGNFDWEGAVLLVLITVLEYCRVRLPDNRVQVLGHRHR